MRLRSERHVSLYSLRDHFTEASWKYASSVISIFVLFSSQGYAVGIMYFCISTPATVTETDAAKFASEQDLSGGAARRCSVASLTHAARSAPEPYDHKRISGATDYQGHHGMELLVVSHKLQGHTRFTNYFEREVQMFSETQVMIFFCLGLLLVRAPLVVAHTRQL